MADKPDARPTLASVAAAAGVSRQTVSNVLNAPGRVRPETIDHVRHVLTAMGYRPNLAARQLRTGRSGMIGMRMHPVVDGINGAILDHFLHAFTESAQDHGYRLVLFTAGSDQEEIDQYSELLDTTAIDAFVLTQTHYEDTRTRWLEAAGTPFVTFGRPWSAQGEPETSRHSWTDVDGAIGTTAAVEYLAGLGHTRIGFVGWPAESGTGDERRAGWRQAMRALGADDADLAALDVATADGVAQGAEAARILRARSAPTALVCASDSLALGALGSPSRREGAVIGYDDTPVAAAIGLTSVAQPLQQVANAALASLIRQIADPTAPPTHELFAPHLVIRDSTPRAG